jgi:membrane protein implicated in regulation of membrane protease activity
MGGLLVGLFGFASYFLVPALLLKMSAIASAFVLATLAAFVVQGASFALTAGKCIALHTPLTGPRETQAQASIEWRHPSRCNALA